MFVGRSTIYLYIGTFLYIFFLEKSLILYHLFMVPRYFCNLMKNLKTYLNLLLSLLVANNSSFDFYYLSFYTLHETFNFDI